MIGMINVGMIGMILLMSEIPNNHLGCLNPVNDGINYLSTGGGFQPSTVLPLVSLVELPIRVSLQRASGFLLEL